MVRARLTPLSGFLAGWLVLMGCPAPSNVGPEPEADGSVVLDPCQASDRDGDGFGTDPSCARPDCDDDNFAVRPGATEACNGLDDDCDDEIDEDLGDSWCGQGQCRVRLLNCIDGRPSRCEPSTQGGLEEACNGRDDDCDGEIDEDLVGPGCGVGACARRAECASGQWQTCTPGRPRPETCSGEDDDCDGTIDEGFGVFLEDGSYNALRTHAAECNGASERMGASCNTAFHRRCAAKACTQTGLGPLENSGDHALLACIEADVRAIDFSALTAHHPGCRADGQRIGPECNAAIHRYCQAQAFTTGFGPVSSDGTDVEVSCLRAGRATVVFTTYSTLSTRHGGCTTSRRIGPDCNAAIHRHCTQEGFVTGFGPLENSGNEIVIACLRP